MEKKERRSTPHMLEWTKFLEILEDFINEFGNNRKRVSNGPWKKRSIFFTSY